MADNPVRSNNDAWNEDYSKNVYAQWSFVKVQVWELLGFAACATQLWSSLLDPEMVQFTLSM